MNERSYQGIKASRRESTCISFALHPIQRRPGRRASTAAAAAERNAADFDSFLNLNHKRMGRWAAARSGIPIAFLLAAASSIPSASAAASTSPTKRGKTFSPSSQLLSELSIEADRGVPSAVFPIYGNVYPDGLYYVTMYIGDPPKPYFLDIDTGSDLTWLQCNAPCVSCSKGPHPWYRPNKNKLVPCSDPLCAALHPGVALEQDCDQCDYELHYEDRSSSLGVLVADSFSLRLTNTTIARPILAFGCGYNQQPQIATEPTDGVLGLGTGKVSILSQLSNQGVTKNVMGHCLSGKGGGYLFFGDDLVPSSRITWAPMYRIGSRNYYSPGPANLYWGSQYLGVKHMEVVLDTGSTFSYFGSQPYQTFLAAVKSDLAKTPLKEQYDDPSLPVCWKGQKPFKYVSDVKKYFKSLSLNFVNGKRALLEMPPENYLIITKYGNACLGILNGTEAGLNNLNVIGDISLQDHLVVYDNEKQRIGWVRESCNRLPNAFSDDGGLEDAVSQFAAIQKHYDL